MSSYGLVAVFLLVCTWAFSEAQMSCKGRCGIEYYRGRTCQCDYSCLVYGECCKDFEKICTSKSSCKGRCGETFKRGRTCECDSECVKYKKCCPDYEDHCTADPIPESEEETEHIEGRNPDDQTTTAQTTPPEMNENPTSAPTVPLSEMPETTLASEESTVTVYSASPVAENTEVTTIVPTTINQETTAAPEITTASADPSTLAPEDVDATTVELPDVMEISTAAPTSKPETEKPDPEKPKEPAPEEVNATTVEVPDVSPSSTAAPTSKPKPEKPFKPSLDPDNKPVLNGLSDSAEYPADDSNDMDLCSGRPISGVTSLSNGTLVVFRGHFFWVLDRNRVPGPAQSITQVWGVPSPIDTVFTRCNCQAKTYIFKGSLYWRFENAVLDPGFPQRIDKEFDGLRGQIMAALSVPQYKRRMESVYFFRRGGYVQKYSYQFNPTCGRRVHLLVYTRNRAARQVPTDVVSLGPSIKYKTSWRGFPATVTAAVSIPNRSEPEGYGMDTAALSDPNWREPEGYGYYVFSGSKSYKIQLEEDRPVIATPKPSSTPQNYEVFKCPKKVSK